MEDSPYKLPLQVAGAYGATKLPGAAGILGLGLFGLIASLFGGDGKGKGDNKFRVGGAEASSIPYIPSGFGALRPKAEDIGGTKSLTKQGIKLSVSEREKQKDLEYINKQIMAYQKRLHTAKKELDYENA